MLFRSPQPNPIAVRCVTKEACGRSRLFCLRPRFSPAPRFRLRHFDAIPHEAARATTFPRDACATREVAWEPLRPNAKSASNTPAPQPCQRSRPDANPSPGLLTSRVSRFKSHRAAQFNELYPKCSRCSLPRPDRLSLEHFGYNPFRYLSQRSRPGESEQVSATS